MGQTSELPWKDGTLDIFIAELLEAKLRLINAVEADDVPSASVLDQLYEKLRLLGPALLQENKALQATGEIRDRLEALAKTDLPQAHDAPSLRPVSMNSKALVIPGLVYRVTFGRVGHLECSCDTGAAEAHWPELADPLADRRGFKLPAEQFSCSEMTGFRVRTERCSGDLGRLRFASGSCPAW